MVNENIDIAMILSNTAGKLLSQAYILHKQMSETDHNDKEYFLLRGKEREICIEVVILFQASMEAMINEEITNEKKLRSVQKESERLSNKFKVLSFKNKWQLSFKALAISSKEVNYLEKYLLFYIKFRVPITHAKSRYVNAELFNFLNIYDGVKNGYLAIEAFYRHLEKHSFEHRWKEFAKKSSLPE